jgi:hypothetical protein
MSDIVEEQIMWFPGIYHGRQSDEWQAFVIDVVFTHIRDLVQARVQEEGEWLIANGRVGTNNENEVKMRRMMAFASDEKNILQCWEHVYRAGEEEVRTVDYIARELANASKTMIR